MQANWEDFGLCHSAVPAEEVSINPMRLLNSGPLRMESEGFLPVVPPPAAPLQYELSTPTFTPLIPKNESPMLVSLELNISADPVLGAPPDEAALCREGTGFLLGGLVPKKGRRRRKVDGDEYQDEDEAEPMEPPQSMNPQDYYGVPQKKPEPWGWRKGGTGKCIFTYNELGELEYGKVFSRSELEAYLYAQASQRSSSSKNDHAHDVWVERQLLPGEKHIRGKRRHGLTLWVGWAPAQLNDRFPSPESHKCRFKGCPARDGKFRGGQPRVAFDERMNVDGSRDPYHVAGYMHLFCLEQQFDILKLAADLDIRLDTRYFTREEAGNPASFRSRQNAHQQIKAAHNWLAREWQRFVAWDKHVGMLRVESKLSGRRLTREQTARPRHFDDSLTKNMVETDVENYSTAGKECRKARSKEARAQGKTMVDAGAHLGNLEFIREQLDIRNNKERSTKLSREKSIRLNDTTLGHRVYELDHFIEGFQPGRRGPSTLDALGWFRESPKASPCAQNEVRPLTHDYYGQPPFLLSPAYGQSSESVSRMSPMIDQAQISYPNPIVSGISMTPSTLTDHVSNTFDWMAQGGSIAPVPCTEQHMLVDANQSAAPVAALVSPIDKRQELDDSRWASPVPERPVFEVSHIAEKSNWTNSLECIPCEAESRPIVYVNRGENPIDIQFRAKTNKRIRDDMPTQYQDAGFNYLSVSGPETIVGDVPSPCKKARIDSLMLDVVTQGHNPDGSANGALEVDADMNFDLNLYGTVPIGTPNDIQGGLQCEFANTASQCFDLQMHSAGTASQYENAQQPSPDGEISAQDHKLPETRVSTSVQNYDFNFDEFLYGDWDKSEDFSSLFIDHCLPSVPSSM